MVQTDEPRVKPVLKVSFLLFTASRFPLHDFKISTLVVNEKSATSKVCVESKLKCSLYLLGYAEACNEFAGLSLRYIAPRNNTGEMWLQWRVVGTTAPNRLARDLNLKPVVLQAAIANLLAAFTFAPRCLLCSSWSSYWSSCTLRSSC